MLAAPGAGQTNGQIPATPCSLETGASGSGESPRASGMCICGWWFKGRISSEAPSLHSSPLPLQHPCSLSPTQVQPMTPSVGATPDEAQLPAGPPATGVAIFGQVPVLWAPAIWGTDSGSGSPQRVVLRLDLSLGSSLPLQFFSSSPTTVNISRKWKRKKKRQKKKMEYNDVAFSKLYELIKTMILNNSVCIKLSPNV